MWDDARQLNAVAMALAMLAGGLFLWGALAWAARQPVFELRDVVIRGPLRHASGAHLEAVVRDELAGTFFTIDLPRARAAIARVPWVRSVALRRRWPRELEITVEEHEPFARWNEDGLVNMQGEVFAADYNGELPQFAGPDGRAPEVAERYRQAEEALAPLALAVEAVRLSPRGGWRVSTKGPAGHLDIELPREDGLAALARFAAVYDRTIGASSRAGTRIDYVDLRYRNGFATRVPGFRERAPKKVAG